MLNIKIKELRQKLSDKDISSVELIKYYHNRINRFDPEIKSFISLNETALEEASLIDQKRAKGDHLPPFAGIPIALKDLIITKNIPTTCGSKILEHFIPPYDATVTKHLKDAGFIIMGKLNMDEFAMGSSCETSYFNKTRNPWDTNRVPGGSSGGSAAAVAARLIPLSLGSDTGGSIRQPGALCGVVGLKPTYGGVSRYGLVAFASSLDQIGPFTTNVEDTAEIMTVIGKHDDKDSTSAKIDNHNYMSGLSGNIKGLKIGLPKEYFSESLNDELKNSIFDALKIMEKCGAEIVDIDMPHTEYAVAVYYIIATAEASSNLARYDGVKYGYRADGKNLNDMYVHTKSSGFGEEVKRRIMLGTYALSSGYYDAYYLKAQKVRTLIKNDFISAFKKVDLIATPTSPTTAFKLGEKLNDPLQMYLNDIYTIPLNLYGGCGISIPCGFDKKMLPLGLQLLGGYFEESRLLNCAYAFERATDWHTKIPDWLAEKE